MDSSQKTMSNRATLENAGLIPKKYDFSKADSAIIESLTREEVNALINIANKLTLDLLKRTSKDTPVGILF
jgi:uncharacterized protein YjgD (DUF1641 family)